MATGAGVEEKSRADDFRHTCGLCMEPYRGRHPKILPCFHTFCLPCLKTLAESAAVESRRRAASAQQDCDKEERQSGQADSVQTAETAERGGQRESGGEREGGGGSGDAREGVDVRGGGGEATAASEKKAATPVSFLCPTCRTPVTVPEEGVKSLQTNFYLDHDEADVACRPVSCDLCEEDQKQDATHACQECQMNMCRSCRRCHDKVPSSRAHHVTPVGQGAPVSMTSTQAERKLCQSHPDQPLCFFCQKCDVTICLHCKLTSHEGHVTVDVSVAAAQARKDVEGLHATLTDQISVLTSLLDRLDQEERQLERQEQEVTREVSTRYDVAVTWLTEARDDVLSDVKTRKKKALRELQAERVSARAALERLQSGQSHAVGVACMGPDVVHVKSQLQDVLLDQATIRQHAERAAREVKVTALGCHVTEGGLDKELVRQYLGQLQDGQTHIAEQFGALLSVRDIADQLTSLKAEMTTLKTELSQKSKNITGLKDELSQKSTDITGLKDELSQKSTDISGLKDELSQTSMQMSSIDQVITDLRAELAKCAGDASTRDKTLSATVDTLSNQLAAVTDKLHQTVFFHVGLDSDTEFDSVQTIVFSDVHSNTGDGYDVKTGYFTAPVSGTYLFLASVGNRGYSGTVYGVIQADGKRVARAHGCPESSGSGHAVVRLQAGKKTRVWAEVTDGGGMFHLWDTWFSGVLLSM